jgi:hypothetical protein
MPVPAHGRFCRWRCLNRQRIQRGSSAALNLALFIYTATNMRAGTVTFVASLGSLRNFGTFAVAGPKQAAPRRNSSEARVWLRRSPSERRVPKFLVRASSQEDKDTGKAGDRGSFGSNEEAASGVGKPQGRNNLQPSLDLGFSSEYLTFLDSVELPESFPSYSHWLNLPKGRPECEQCRGAGEILCPVCEGKGYYALEILGTVSAGQCGMCRGTKKCPCPTCKEHIYLAMSDHGAFSRKGSETSTDEQVSRFGVS